MLPESPELSSLKKLSLTIHMGQNSKILMDLTSLIERSPFLHRLELEVKLFPHLSYKFVTLKGLVRESGLDYFKE